MKVWQALLAGAMAGLIVYLSAEPSGVQAREIGRFVGSVGSGMLLVWLVARWRGWLA